EDSRYLRSGQREQVAKVLAFARELGAEVITVPDDNAVTATLRIAAQRSVTQIVVGKPPEETGRVLFRRDRFASALLKRSRDIGVQFIPVNETNTPQPRVWAPNTKGSKLVQYLKAIGVIEAVTLAAFLFAPVVGPHATALVFLLTVVLLALFVSRGPTLVAAV